MEKFTDLEETVYFWTRNDSSIISDLFSGNREGVWQRAEVAIQDNKGILHEYQTGVRKAGSYFGDPLDYKMIESLKNRLFENLDDQEKRKQILETAKHDIVNILGAMKPPKSKITLYRSKWKDLNDLSRWHVHDTVEFASILSASVTPYKEETDYDFYRLEITVPESGLMLALDQFSCHNEDGEVLLPPMKCKITNIRNSENEKCKGIIALEYLEKLPVNTDAL